MRGRLSPDSHVVKINIKASYTCLAFYFEIISLKNLYFTRFRDNGSGSF